MSEIRIRYYGSEAVYIDDAMFVPQNGRYMEIRYQDIGWLEASGSYCYIHLRENEKVIVEHSLSRLNAKLPPEVFVRIHRLYIVNIYAAKGFIGNVLLIRNHRLTIGRTYRDKVSSMFTEIKCLSDRT